jgi:hypothetical protein
MSVGFKKIITVSLMLFFGLRVFAPGNRSLVIYDSAPVKPFRTLIHAIGMVETKHDTLAFNPLEDAVGYFQIRPIRLQDYNFRTGSHYTMTDLFNYRISEKIFLFYASEIGPYNFEEIAKRWNGSGKTTLQYWKRVQDYL